jgi:hypothetical protein
MNSNTNYKQKDTGQYISTSIGGGGNYAQTSPAEALGVPYVFFLALFSMSFAPSLFLSPLSFMACLLVACCLLLAALLHSLLSFILPSTLLVGDYKLQIATQFSTASTQLKEPRTCLFDYILACN